SRGCRTRATGPLWRRRRSVPSHPQLKSRNSEEAGEVKWPLRLCVCMERWFRLRILGRLNREGLGDALEKLVDTKRLSDESSAAEGAGLIPGRGAHVSGDRDDR